MNMFLLNESRAKKFAAHEIWALQKFDENMDDQVEDEIQEDDKTDDNKKFLICKVCQNTITAHEAVVQINGSHRHKFINPGGVVYRVGCFQSAPGCLVLGVPTREFTWFPGYSWSYAVCSNCNIHMGWSYQSEGGGFFGLVIENLSEG